MLPYRGSDSKGILWDSYHAVSLSPMADARVIEHRI